MPRTVATQREKVLPEDPLHPVNTLMEEHRFILRSLDALRELLPRLRAAGSHEEMGADRETLRGIAHHLVDAENHHQREEDALFPRLVSRGVTTDVQELRADHVVFREKKRRLYQLANGPADAAFDAFRAGVLEAGEYIVRELVAHIAREDDTVYQAAMDVLTREDWDDVKRECDAIGYCCFKPADQVGAAPVVHLDMRGVPMLQRLDAILKAWKELPPGQSIRLINDREPLPLKLMFKARENGRHAWTYEKEGSPEWVALIRKVG